MMNEVFYGCSSLISIPDISNWKISEDKKINNIFDHYISLTESSSFDLDSKDNAFSLLSDNDSKDYNFIIKNNVKSSNNNDNSYNSYYESFYSI